MIDSHCHLDFNDFDTDRDRVIDSARTAGVHTIINIGADLASSERSVALAEKYDFIYATVGVHPHDARKFDDKMAERISRLAEHDKVRAIGEIGLDFYRDLSPRKVQAEVFERQLEIAVQKGMPVVIHTRKAFRETVEIVKRHSSRLCGGVFHCFPGNEREAQQVIDLGFKISVGGVITYPKAGMARMAAAVPLKHILLETDCPYLTPVPYRGKRNEPAHVKIVCQKLSELKNITFEEVEKTTDRNAQKLFGLIETFGG